MFPLGNDIELQNSLNDDVYGDISFYIASVIYLHNLLLVVIS